MEKGKRNSPLPWLLNGQKNGGTRRKVSWSQVMLGVSLLSLTPLFYKIRKGERIIRAGDRVTPEQHFILQEIARYQKRSVALQSSLGLALLIAAILGIFVLDLRRYRPAVLTDLSQLLLLAILICGTILIVEFFHFLLGSFVDRFAGLEPSPIIYALPVAAGAMLTTLLFASCWRMRWNRPRGSSQNRLRPGLRAW